LFLKSLEIFGFKSFADRARIEFTPGITALLGPNGCGKSNVVDALKWVLGEQASKSLRADKMEDVIFNGTEGRKALNVAEVTLVIGNEDGHLALDLPEIAVKRRLYRSGESEYFINNAAVRLKEVRELFYDTGVGKSAYSVMEQGRIDQILSTKPEERRYIFEEAAGITKFRARGQEAERRLEKTEENIRALEGILGEVRRTWESLKKQCEKTQSYRALRQQIFVLEKDQVVDRLRSLYAERDKLSAKVEKKAADREAARQALESLTKALEGDLGEVSRLEAHLVALQKDLYDAELARSGLENQVGLQKERQRQLAEDLSRGQAQAQAIADKKAALEAEQAARKADRESLDAALTACRTNIAEFDGAVETARSTVAANVASRQGAEQRVEVLEAEDIRLQNDMRQVTDRLVQELDQRLKDEGFAWHKLPHLTGEMEGSLGSLKVLLQGRRDLLASAASTGAVPGGDGPAFHNQLASALTEALGHLASFETGWDTYRKAVPKFLEEFLSPDGIITQRRALEDQLGHVRVETKTLKDEIKRLTDENAALALTIEGYRHQLEELRLAEVKMQTQRTAAEEALERLSRDLSEQASLAAVNAADVQAIVGKQAAAAVEVDALGAKIVANQAVEQGLKDRRTALQNDLGARNQALIGRQKELRDAQEKAAVLQSEGEGLQVQTAQVAAEIKAVFDAFRDKHSVELSEYEAEIRGPAADRGDLRESLAQKREELRALGQVNLMAVEEFAEIDERHGFLAQQLTDLKKAREDLNLVTKEIRRESAQLFSDTFAQIKENFNVMFRRLFGGGRAELKLTDPDNVLESGIEMLCQPPGKKLESINLLSGGEKSMTAVALLFATFQVKPSPFCILDEIDAALDESNVGRFVGTLAEFGAKSQFVVITHNKRTVTGASTMIGVTMESPGVSKIIAIRLAGGNVEVAP
jgi:chromosome segregation protein